jgi:hypothetical protein
MLADELEGTCNVQLHTSCQLGSLCFRVKYLLQSFYFQIPSTYVVPGVWEAKSDIQVQHRGSLRDILTSRSETRDCKIKYSQSNCSKYTRFWSVVYITLNAIFKRRCRSQIFTIRIFFKEFCSHLYHILSWILAARHRHIFTLSFDFISRRTFFSMPRQPPSGPRPPHCWGLETTVKHTTLGRTHLNEWTDRHRDLYLTTHNTHKWTPMSPTGFEPAIRLREQPQNHVLDRSPTGKKNPLLVQTQGSKRPREHQLVKRPVHSTYLQ